MAVKPIEKIPLTIGGCVVWLDAANLLGFGVANPADSTSVGTWSDLSGMGKHAVQATEARKPIFKTNILAGLPGVLGVNASNQFLQISSAAGGILEISPGVTVFAVFTETDATLASAGIFSKDTGNGITNQPYGLTSGGGGGFTALTGVSTTSTNGINNITTALGVLTNGTAYVAQMGVDGSTNTPSVKFNTTAASTGSSAADPLGKSNAPLNILCGKNNGIRSFSGYLHEFVLFNRTLTTGEALIMRKYLANKWGVNAN